MISFLLVLAAAPPPSAETLLEKVFKTHGSERLRNATLSFDFRGVHYEAFRNGGTYRYTRRNEQEGHRFEIVLDNRGLTRTVDGAPFPTSPSQKASFGETVNSVVYFASLPLALQHPKAHCWVLK
ncbi:MAG: hypothetical protein AAFQ82_19355, partial [Myxococcota bacterium]